MTILLGLKKKKGGSNRHWKLQDAKDAADSLEFNYGAGVTYRKVSYPKHFELPEKQYFPETDGN